MKILVLGSQGQLGRCLEDQFSNSYYEVIFASRSEIDLGNTDQIYSNLSNINPDVVINAAAYTFVDKAESEKEKAILINETAVANIASICKKVNCWFVHISTDYLFDGNSKRPYVESDKPNPQCVYGKSKLNGELSIIESNCKYIIIRTAWVYSEHGNNFLKTMLKLEQTNNEVSVVSDQFGTPTYAQDLARAIIQILKYLNTDKVQGIYNYAGSSLCSWADFAELIFEESHKLNDKKDITKVINIKSSDYPTTVKRPSFSALDNSLFESTFNFSGSDWKVGVKEVVKVLHDIKINE